MMNRRIATIGIAILALLAVVTTVLARELPNGVDGPILLLRQAATQTPIPSQTPTTHVDLDAWLVGSAVHPTASGSADYNIDHNGDSEIEVNVRGLSVLTGQSIDVYVDGTLVGSMVIDGNGQGRFEAESDNGQIVPALAIDSTIDLRLGAEVVASSWPLTNDNYDNANDNGDDDDNVNDNDDNANDNDDDDDNGNDNDGDDNVNDNDDNANDNDDDDDDGDNDDNANDNDNDDDNGNDNDGDNDNDDDDNDNDDDNINDNDDDDDNGNDNDDDNGNDNDDDNGNDNDDDNGNDNDDDGDDD